MQETAMNVFGHALQRYADGDTDATLTIRREDGKEAPLPVAVFFREPADFSAIDLAAVDNASGNVLDAGAGTGIHTLAIQRSGLTVTAIDISQLAVKIMQDRGVKDARCDDLLTFCGGRYDTVLMMGHGVGMVKTLSGLDQFLSRAHRLVTDQGQVLLESLDVRVRADERDQAYQQANQEAGRYFGEIRMQFQVDDAVSPMCEWLHVDPDILRKYAIANNWQFEGLHSEPSGDYLARLSKGQSC